MENDFEIGCQKFDENNYEKAWMYWIKSYESGEYQAEIEKIMADCFLLPNEGEFKNNYAENNQEISKLGYEELPVEFIWVKEEVYYLFDREKKRFLGKFEDRGIEYGTDEWEFDSTLIADTWDIREALPYLQKKRYSMAYWCLDGNEKYFMSFFKLPGFFEKYMQNIIVFPSKEIMELYFKTYPQFYLPKQFLTKEEKPYYEMFQAVHEMRISKQPQEEVFLSICIPSYNRGSKALRSVINILRLPYDSEIEVVVSDNGSTEDTEGYDAIKQIPDTRVHYVRLETNEEYAMNVCNVLRHAKGKFAMLASDEDILIIEKLPVYLNELWNNMGAGVVLAGGQGSNLSNFNGQLIRKNPGLDSYESGLNLNYITGVTFQMEHFGRKQVIERFQANRGNLFMEYYTHAAFALMACEDSFMCYSGTKIWIEGEDEKKEEDGELGVTYYMTYESRMEQLKSSVEMLAKVMRLAPSEFFTLFLDRVRKAYRLLYICCISRPKSFRKLYHWTHICHSLYKYGMGLLEEYKERFPGDLLGEALQYMRDVFWDYVWKNPDKPAVSSMENAQEQITLYLLKEMCETGQELGQIDLDDLEQKTKTWLEDSLCKKGESG